MNDYFTSQIRTWTPILVGSVLSWLATQGLSVDMAGPHVLLFVTSLTGFITALYYSCVRLLERKFPKLGWLLGNPSQPKYDTPK